MTDVLLGGSTISERGRAWRFVGARGRGRGVNGMIAQEDIGE